MTFNPPNNSSPLKNKTSFNESSNPVASEHTDPEWIKQVNAAFPTDLSQHPKLGLFSVKTIKPADPFGEPSIRFEVDLFEVDKLTFLFPFSFETGPLYFVPYVIGGGCAALWGYHLIKAGKWVWNSYGSPYFFPESKQPTIKSDAPLGGSVSSTPEKSLITPAPASESSNDSDSCGG